MAEGNFLTRLGKRIFGAFSSPQDSPVPAQKISTEKRMRRGDNNSLTMEEVAKKMRDEVERLQVEYGIPKNCTRQLLKHFNWNSQKITKTFIDDFCIDEISTKGLLIELHETCQDETPALLCGICFEEAVESIFCLGCSQTFCRPCFQDYISHQILNNALSCYFECPGSNCKAVLDDEIIVSHLRHNKERQIFEKVVTSAFVESNEKFRFCPAPDCNFIIERKNEKSVSCACGLKFCFECGFSCHEPLPCEVMKAWQAKTLIKSEDKSLQTWLTHGRVKICPNCNILIDKNGGCPHMICTKCKFEFCWICDRDMTQNIGHDCNLYSTTAINSESAVGDENFMKIRNNYNAVDRMLVADAEWFEFQDEPFLEIVYDCLKVCRQILLLGYVASAFIVREGKENELESFKRSFYLLGKDLDELTFRSRDKDDAVPFTDSDIQEKINDCWKRHANFKENLVKLCDAARWNL